MASKLTQWINASLKNKGMTAKQAQKNAYKYKSIAAAKKAGSLYYKDKNGKIMIAAYAEDLKKIPKVKMDDPKALKGVIISKKPVLRGDSQESKPKPTNLKKTPVYKKTPLKKVPTQKTTGDGTGDPYNSGKTKVAEKAPRPEKNKGGPVTKKPKGAYAAGGLKATSANQVGLKRLPKSVRNKMGYMSKGGMTTKRNK